MTPIKTVGIIKIEEKKEGEIMEKNIQYYLKHHTLTITFIIFSAIFILATGEYFLYRKIMLVNKMVSEGFMQIKEAAKNRPSPTIFMKK